MAKRSNPRPTVQPDKGGSRPPKQQQIKAPPMPRRPIRQPGR
jgi:hypothetical protein